LERFKLLSPRVFQENSNSFDCARSDYSKMKRKVIGMEEVKKVGSCQGIQKLLIYSEAFNMDG
jgi:hypothetical protein